MWVVMMAVMMLPVVTPWLVMLGRFASPPHGPGGAWAAGPFLGGYLVTWTGFSVVAAGIQRWLADTALASPMGVPTDAAVGGLVLCLAGLFQLTPVKDRCLTHCRSPFGFFLTSWRPGRWGAVRMGAHHGLYCVGCCWALMLLAFVGGTMHPLWMVGVTAYIIIDQLIAATARLSRASGVILVAWGGWQLAQAW